VAGALLRRLHRQTISGSSSQAAGMQSWIRDLIDLKTQISVLQNCMQQPASSHAPPASHYRVADNVNRGRRPLLPSIQPLPGQTVCCGNGLGISGFCSARSAGQAAARSIGPAAPESTHFCTNVPLDFIVYCLPVACGLRVCVRRRGRPGNGLRGVLALRQDVAIARHHSNRPAGSTRRARAPFAGREPLL
jgi:hypothetical protein